MQQILILGAGKSATILIQTLLHEAEKSDLYIHVADISEELIHAKTGRHPRSKPHLINPGNPGSLEMIIAQSEANLVISMLPPPLHPHVALICVKLNKHFLNASYLTPEIQALHDKAKSSGLTFICELGLDPGIDHMSAMEMIDEIRKVGRITSFRSHCGGLISPESDTNPWHYKISWNPRNIVMAGSDGAAYLENGQEHFVPYNQLFNSGQCVDVPEHGSWAWYANRDSISYISKYGLTGVKDFVRTTLRHPDFCHGWKHIVDLKLTNDSDKIHITDMTTRSFFELHSNAFPEKSWADPITNNLFSYLGFFDDEPLPKGEYSSADLLQWILERKLVLAPTDRDMIIMLHEIEYESNGKTQKRSAHMVVKGKDQQNTAMAITVGLPLAIAAMYILEGKISRPGVSIPLYPEIYSVILPELEKRGIGFTYND